MLFVSVIIPQHVGNWGAAGSRAGRFGRGGGGAGAGMRCCSEGAPAARCARLRVGEGGRDRDEEGRGPRHHGAPRWYVGAAVGSLPRLQHRASAAPQRATKLCRLTVSDSRRARADDFQSVVAFMEGVGVFSKGIQFATTKAVEVLERYDIDREAGTPAILALVNFDEDGNMKRGKKRRIDMDINLDLQAPFSQVDVRNFVVQAALPPVIRLPEMNQEGVDLRERVSIAFSTQLPKLFTFTRGRATDELTEALLHVSKGQRGKLVAFQVEVDGGDDSVSFMQQVGLDASDLDDAPGSFVTVMVDPTHPKRERRATRYEGEANGAQMEEFALETIRTHPIEDAFPPEEGAKLVRGLEDDAAERAAKKKRGKKNKKKKKKKTKKKKTPVADAEL